MAKSEKVFWYVLEQLNNRKVTMSQKLLDNPAQESHLEHAAGIDELESELVLKFEKSEIEDTLYFLEKRSYLVVHGYGLMNPRMAYALTKKALEILELKKLPEEEVKAFDTAILDLSKPGIWGMKFDIKSAWKKGKRKVLNIVKTSNRVMSNRDE